MNDLTKVILAAALAVFFLGVCGLPPEPESVETWRLCGEECGHGLFILDFSTDPPTCLCKVLE